MIGQMLGPYRIVEKLGEGGMGEVYKARDTRLGRIVAIKVLAADAATDADRRRRFEQEARAVSALNHPHICVLYDVGREVPSAAGGLPGETRPSEPIDFLVMEYLEGETLAERIRRGPLPPAEVLELGAQIADALARAHRHGIVHRDLKPANVMLTKDGVKLLDFGLAKLRAQPPAGTTAASELSTVAAGTAPGRVMGTVPYMAPEQLEGRECDARTDLFAFGCVLYEMLTGRRAFGGKSEASIISAIMRAEPAPLGTLQPLAPPALERLVTRCLAKDPDERWDSAHAAAEELRGIAQDEAGPAPPAPVLAASPAAHGRPFWLKAASVASVATLIVLVAWIIATFTRGGEPVLAFKARDWMVVADFENQTQDPVFDRSLDRALAVGIAQSRHVNVVPRNRIDEALRRMGRTGPKPLDEPTAAEVAVREGARAVLACSIAQVGDGYVLTARLIDPASRTAVLTGSARAAGRNGVLGALDELLTAIRHDLGESLTSIAQQKRMLPTATTTSLEALSAYARGIEIGGREGIELVKQAVALDPEFALAHAALGAQCYLGGDRKAGEAHFEKALGLVDRLTVRERLWIETLAEDFRGRREEAVTAYRAYLAQYPDDSQAWFRLGWTLMAPLGRLDEAIPAFERSLELHKSSAAYVNIATCYGGLDRDAEAIAYYEKAFDLNPADRTGTFVNHEYGFTLVRAGRAGEARAAFEKMSAEQDIGKQAIGLRSLALLDMFEGRYAAAIERLKRAVALNQAARAPVTEFRNRMYLATGYSMLGRNADAERQMAAARRLASTNRFDPFWLQLLGSRECRHRRVAEARALLRRAGDSANDPVAAGSVNRSTSGDLRSIQLLEGEIALAEGRADDALDLFEAALRMRPAQTDAMECMGRALTKLGRPAEAREKYEAILAARQFGSEEQQSYFLAHLELGRILERDGDPAGARRHYERLLALWKSGDPDLLPLAEARERLKKLDAAAAALPPRTIPG